MARRYRIVNRIPPPGTPFLENNGTLTYPWRKFFENVQEQLGGAEDDLFDELLSGVPSDPTTTDPGGNQTVGAPTVGGTVGSGSGGSSRGDEPTSYVRLPALAVDVSGDKTASSPEFFPVTSATGTFDINFGTEAEVPTDFFATITAYTTNRPNGEIWRQQDDAPCFYVDSGRGFLFATTDQAVTDFGGTQPDRNGPPTEELCVRFGLIGIAPAASGAAGRRTVTYEMRVFQDVRRGFTDEFGNPAGTVGGPGNDPFPFTIKNVGFTFTNASGLSSKVVIFDGIITVD